MNEQPFLSDREWQLVLELLQAERRELPSELHHTDSRQIHEELEQRLKMVEGLIERLRGQLSSHPVA